MKRFLEWLDDYWIIFVLLAVIIGPLVFLAVVGCPYCDHIGHVGKCTRFNEHVNAECACPGIVVEKN